MLLQFLQTLTSCYNICCIVDQVNLQHNNYRFARLTYVGLQLLHYLGENFLLARQCVSIPCTSDDRATAV